LVELSEVRTKVTHKKKEKKMAHQLEMIDGKASMFYTREVPWHGLGQRLEENPSISEAIAAAGLDWEVGLKATQTIDGEPLPNQAVCRKTDGKILGVVGPKYTPLQNREAFDWFEPFLETGECSLETAGSLYDGKKIWALARINKDCSEIVPGDDVCKYLTLSNSHDGTTAIRPMLTPVRSVCQNTLALAHKHQASQFIRIRHTRSAKLNLEKVRELINLANNTFEATAEQYRFLASRSFNQKDVEKYVKECLEVDESKEISTRTKNIIQDVLERLENPRQNLPGVYGTYWAAYNAFSERLNYAQGRTVDSRLDSLWFGQGVGTNRKALELATQYANAV
jgi:phage/plasmid-like protein (TIGR03299 family)